VFGEDLVPYLPEHIKPPAQQLKQFPSGYEKWVYATSSPTETYQGDVFTRVPLVFIDENGDAVRAETKGMVISSTCDAQPGQGEAVLVAPVVDLEDFVLNAEFKGEQLENHVRALTANKLSEIMFLPEGHGITRSFVDFGKISPVSVSHFHSERGQNRLISLSQCGHYFLLVKLAYHFSRPEAPDAKRY
jgi:hypothetical protein